ncbi:hypothetical protein [Bdellovibrio bacteriovorus]|uniref:Uncharacterized protein n=1 Tax=Bdellovibrio bacteriovorus TaxID=959 RepID=A0A1Z3N7F9_BDEBC|nr:hypothetical protein [Bdellovibrio bacteriovorus]ASD63377.1 hypothetical protein B9G79_07220 [Bdellovibrio bacteriovorus]
MIILTFLLSFFASAASPEQNVMAVFDKSHGIYEKFKSDTMKYREETEAFNENEFIPAVDKMRGLLAKKNCQKCLRPYLVGLSYLEQSASEELVQQLKEIILHYPKEINGACRQLKQNTKKALVMKFKDAVRVVSEEKKIKEKETEKKIRYCF